MFSAFHPFLDWALLGQKALIFLLSPCFPFLCSWAFWLLNLPYHFIMSAIALPLLSFLVIPWAYRPVLLLCSPLLHQSFARGVLSPLFISLPLLGFIGEHSCCASPFHYFIPRASLTRLPHFYLFYFHGLFAKFFGFFDLITISLLLITFRAYWPLSRPIEFTNLFLKLP